MQFNAQTLEAFSTQLLALDRAQADTNPARLMHDGLAGLRRLVPFDAAWWGETSGGMDGLAPRNWLSGSIGLSADFAQEWNRIGATDQFALASMQRLGSVVSEESYDDAEPEVEAFCRRHDLYHAMAITRSLPGSGLLQFIALYRGYGKPPFSPEQKLLFGQFSAHLMQRWSRRLGALAGHLVDNPAGEGGTLGDAHGLVDAAGDLLYLGARLALALRARHPQWDGGRLPPPLAAALTTGVPTLKLGPQRLALQRCGELLLLSLAPQHRAAPLPPREMGVALLYADGHTHKQIARDTGLSPATVRTYLQAVYQRLGVSDKVALGRALAGHRPRRRTG